MCNDLKKTQEKSHAKWLDMGQNCNKGTPVRPELEEG
jgi:hypothetical protein